MKSISFRYCRLYWILATFGGLGSALNAGQDFDPELLTVAEASDFRQTSTSAEVAAFIGNYAGVKHVEKFSFGQTVEGREMVGAIVSRKPFKLGERDNRLRVLLLGNIHSGECSGKEALLMLLRKLALEPDHPWLDELVIVIAPNYNADGNDRMGLYHRPGQIGPERGMGLRENAQQLDLNRDFCKLESPEARGLVRLIDQLDPHLFVDCHTTNGSEHRYGVTYDVPHNPSSPLALRDYLRKTFMPTVTERLELEGLSTFYYGNFNREKTAWETFGHEPRYSTEYVGLRGRLAILCEDYSHNPYRNRVLDSEAFLAACLDLAHEHAERIRRLLDDVEREFIERAATNPAAVTLSLDAKLVPFPDKVAIKSFDEAAQPANLTVDFLGDYQPIRTAQLPFAYVLPAESSRQADRLRLHGVRISRVAAEFETEIEVYAIDDIKTAPIRFQRHSMRVADATSRRESRTVSQGAFWIETAQPLGRFAAYMLEPMSNDGWLTWNFFDQETGPGREYPVWRVPGPVKVNAVSVGSIPAANRIALESIYGPAGLRAVQSPRPRWLPLGESYLLEWDGRPVNASVATGALSRDPAQDKAFLRGALEKLAGLSAEEINGLLAGEIYPSADEKQLLLASGRTAVTVDLETKTARLAGKFDGDIQLAAPAPLGRTVALVAGHNLYVHDPRAQETSSLWQVTDNGDENHLNGLLDWVYQEELFGRGSHSGCWFSPTGSQVAFLRFDETGVPRHTVIDHRQFAATEERSPYPNAGDPLPSVGLSVADIATKSVLPIDLRQYSSADFVISSVGWDKVGRHVTFSIQDRGQTWLDVCVADPQTGAVQVLVHDSSPAWIRTPGPPLFTSDGSFFWQSTRSGHEHIYWFDPRGELIKPITKGPWQVIDIYGLSADEKHLYFSGLKDSPLRAQLYRADLASGTIDCLTDPSFDHTIEFNKTMEYFFDVASNVATPPVTVLRKVDGTLVRSIWKDPNDSFSYARVTQPRFLEVPTRDGGLMDAMLILPADFNESRKYPVICCVYGGPNSPSVRDQYGGSSYWWHQMMAQKGFVVWICDNRSSSRRSLEPAWQTHGQLGVNELADLEDGLDWLGQWSWIDAERIGIWGWSYGGFMTSYAMTHSNRFKAGMAGAPVTDWRNYDAIYTERLMKLLSENQAGYDRSSVVNAAGNLHGRLLLVHGTIDENVHVSNTLQLAAALQAADKPFEMMLYPGNRHGVRDPAQELHLWRMISRFFEDNL
jgi:dipeptidyl aminopeptidase/acylaminoacyl peptidase